MQEIFKQQETEMTWLVWQYLLSTSQCAHISSKTFPGLTRTLKFILIFFRYHQGEQVAPVLTIFIGGNHEASNHMQELSYGGWVAPNIYYLGYAGVVQVNGVRIGGISGIYRGYNYERGHFELTPYTDDTVRSVYSIRNLEVFRLSQLSSKMDIMLSHDWPAHIWEHGDGTRNGTKEGLLRFKPGFAADMESGRMGSWPCWELLTKLKPSYWYSAHMHCRFDALVKHSETEQTKFVALDKCLPRRQFFDFIDIGDEVKRTEDGQAILDFQYDKEWLAILSTTNKFLNCTFAHTKLPRAPHDPTDEQVPRWNYTPDTDEIESITQKFQNDLKIPENFMQVVNGFDPEWDGKNFHKLAKPQPMLNPQTTEFCSKMGIDDPLYITAFRKGIDLMQTYPFKNAPQEVPATPEIAKKAQLSLPKPINSDEIDLDDLGDEEEEISQKKAEDLPVVDEGTKKEKVCEEIVQEEIVSEEILESTKSPKRLTEESTDESIKTEPIPPSANQTAAKKFKRRNQELRVDVEDE